jgi:hypothetical protein
VEQTRFVKRICKKSKNALFDGKTSLFCRQDALIVCLNGFADTRRNPWHYNS